MELFQWKFSKEAQPELDKFLAAIASRKNTDSKIQQVIEQIYPEVNKLEPKNQTQHAMDIDEAVIIIDDKTPENSVIDSIPDISILTLTRAETEEKTLNSSVNDFIKNIQETLEFENGLLAHEDILKLSTEYDDFNLTYLFTTIAETMSDVILYNLNHSICSNANADLNNVSKKFCKLVLLPKFKSKDPTQILQSLIKEYAANYSFILRTELLLPLLKFDCVKWHQILVSLLSNEEKQYTLRDFVYQYTDLEVWQLQILNTLITSQTDESIKRRLINLLDITADKFNNEKLFLKLLITLVQSLGQGCEDQEQVLFNIIEKNKTLLKISAHKALREWSSKYNE